MIATGTRLLIELIKDEAGQNLTETVKFSLVYTYHGRSNAPKAGTRSASMPEVALD